MNILRDHGLDLVLLKNIRKLYGFGTDENQFISMKVSA